MQSRDPLKRVEYRRDLPRCQRATVRERDEILGRRRSTSHLGGEREERRSCGWQFGQEADQIGADHFHSATERLFLVLRQEPAPANLLEVHTDQVGIGRRGRQIVGARLDRLRLGGSVSLDLLGIGRPSPVAPREDVVVGLWRTVDL